MCHLIHSRHNTPIPSHTPISYMGSNTLRLTRSCISSKDAMHCHIIHKLKGVHHSPTQPHPQCYYPCTPLISFSTYTTSCCSQFCTSSSFFAAHRLCSSQLRHAPHTLPFPKSRHSNFFNTTIYIKTHDTILKFHT